MRERRSTRSPCTRLLVVLPATYTINVEICSIINRIKYVLKYVTEGTDQAVVELQRTEQNDNLNQPRVIDEIAQFQNARYVGCSEEAWRIIEHPTCGWLAVHLENGQRVMFTEANALERAQSPPPESTPTAFFELCTIETFSKSLKYAELP